ncbi:MAG: DUF411 domain-containing protein [Magnetococcales bacterium]|nr:DUF411 domain-containing protein [Magnetococcales bacterium]
MSLTKKYIYQIRFIALFAIIFTTLPAHAEEQKMVVYKSPSCGCCGGWVEHLQANGFSVSVRNLEDVTPLKERLGVPDRLQSCHTGVIGDYLVEGHVPAADIKRLLRENPDVHGIAVPGMPIGAPGMEMPGEPADAYASITFNKNGPVGIFEQH